MDASTPETFAKIKNVPTAMFSRVCYNVARLTKRVEELKVENGICFKFLLTPDNYTEIYSAVKLAKELRVNDFHLRPVGYLGIKPLEGKELIYTDEMLASIDEQMSRAFELEDKNFHVYGIKHKFNPNLQPKKNFSKWWCIPLLPTFSADGNVYYCFDIRGREDTIMCKHNLDVTEISRWWNSEKHKQMVNNFDVNSCTRCTFAIYNEVVEQVFLKDNMYRNFI
jgi:MoaA/NifB/PqqE/SkfB family radical SAM enzyme